MCVSYLKPFSSFPATWCHIQRPLTSAPNCFYPLCARSLSQLLIHLFFCYIAHSLPSQFCCVFMTQILGMCPPLAWTAFPPSLTANCSSSFNTHLNCQFFYQAFPVLPNGINAFFEFPEHFVFKFVWCHYSCNCIIVMLCLHTVSSSLNE